MLAFAQAILIPGETLMYAPVCANGHGLENGFQASWVSMVGHEEETINLESEGLVFLHKLIPSRPKVTVSVEHDGDSATLVAPPSDRRRHMPQRRHAAADTLYRGLAKADTFEHALEKPFVVPTLNENHEAGSHQRISIPFEIQWSN